MHTLALNIRMQGKLVVIIGGGAVALRKLVTLLVSGASIKVVALEIMPEIKRLHESGLLTFRLGAYIESDLEDAFLVVAATNSTLVNKQICADAHQRRLLISSVDNSVVGNCTFPAILRRGDLEIAVSTGGHCPTFAVDVRDCIARHIGNEYDAILQKLAIEREKLLTNGSPGTYNTRVLHSLAEHLLAELTDRKDLLP